MSLEKENKEDVLIMLHVLHEKNVKIFDKALQSILDNRLNALIKITYEITKETENFKNKLGKEKNE